MATNLERQNGISLYVLLEERIEALIVQRHLGPGDALPSEAELQALYRVSRATVRQALAELEAKGLIDRQQGRGTFIRLPRMERGLPELTSFSEHLAARSIRPSSTLLDYQVVDTGGAVDAPEFPSGTALARVVRLRFANDIPVGLHTVFVDAQLAERIGFTEDTLRRDRTVSLYRLFDAHGLGMSWAEEHLCARGASAKESQLLGVAERTAVMNVRRVTRDPNDRVIEVVSAVYLGDKYDYVVQLERRAHGAVQGGLIRAGRRA